MDMESDRDSKPALCKLLFCSNHLHLSAVLWEDVVSGLEFMSEDSAQALTEEPPSYASRTASFASAMVCWA